MRSFLFLSLAAVSAIASANSSIWVSSVPSYVRPYAIPHYSAQGCVIGQQVYRFPVTGPSSDNAFTLISTAAPSSNYLGVLPHIHERHYENFFNYKGRFQLWTEKDGNEEARLLTVGDYGAVPHNTTHSTYRLGANKLLFEAVLGAERGQYVESQICLWRKLPNPVHRRSISSRNLAKR